MTKIILVAVATLFALACALPSTSAEAAAGTSATPPPHRQGRVHLPVPSMSAEQVAIAVCLSVNQYGPVQAAKAVEDGVGDWIVWVRDKDNDLWLCNASAEGNVYASVLIKGDRLAGRGEEAIALMQVAHTPSAMPEAEKAERVCAAAGRKVDARRLVAIVEDGLGDYVVWLQGNEHTYWLCDASGDAKLYVFERVRFPIPGSTANAGFRAA